MITKKDVDKNKYTIRMKKAAKRMENAKTDKELYLEFFENAHWMMREYGWLVMEDYLKDIGDDFLKSGLKMLCNGIPPDRIYSIMNLKKKRLLIEYESLLDLIVAGACGHYDGTTTDVYMEILRTF